MDRSVNHSRNIAFYFSVFALYFAALVPFYGGLNRIALYIVLPVAFLLTFISYTPINSGRIALFPNRYLKILLILYAWIVFTGLFASDLSLAFRQYRQLLGCFLVCYLFSYHFKNRKNPAVLLYTTYVLLYIAVFYYAINNIMEVIDIGDERVNDAKLNANEFAYFTFCFTYSIFILADIVKNRYLIIALRIAFLLTIPLSFYVAIISASRQVLVIQFPLIVFLLYYRYLKNAKRIRKFIFIILSVGVILFSWNYVESVYSGSFLRQRTELQFEDDARPRLMLDAIRVGIKHPLFGVGPGNYILYSYRGQFSHCSFTELFANDGIPGVIIYLYLLIYFCVNQIKRYRNYKKNMFLYFFAFGIIFFLAQLFYVYYIAQWLIGFFILVASHSETYYQRVLESTL